MTSCDPHQLTYDSDVLSEFWSNGLSGTYSATIQWLQTYVRRRHFCLSSTLHQCILFLKTFHLFPLLISTFRSVIFVWAPAAANAPHWGRHLDSSIVSEQWFFSRIGAVSRGKTRELPFLDVARFWTHNAFKTCISGIFSNCIFQEGSPKFFFNLIPYAQDDDDDDDDDDHDNLDGDDDEDDLHDDDDDDEDDLHDHDGDDDDDDDKDHDKDMRSIYLKHFSNNANKKKNHPRCKIWGKKKEHVRNVVASTLAKWTFWSPPTPTPCLHATGPQRQDVQNETSTARQTVTCED